MKPLDLTKTREAIAAYDEARAAFDAALGVASTGSVDRLLAVLERAERDVGAAFAADTSDRNDPETARRQLPCSWLRGLVAKHGASP
jgi:hypothetical protein